tara:strand:+ start:1811 stop:2191 length:381 start_codon:yes stop_codon:yes gene_type:complete
MIDFRRELMKELGRIPTEAEIGEHMAKVIGSHTKLQRKQKENSVQSSPAIQKSRLDGNAHRRKDSIQASPRVRTINILLGYDLTNAQIANALNLPLHTISDTIYRYRLPRKEVLSLNGNKKNVVGS